MNSVITHYEIDETDTSFQDIKKDNFDKRFRKYVYLSIAAFITTLVWKLLRNDPKIKRIIFLNKNSAFQIY